ncbi:MAG: hypothetical protein WCP58_08435 [bacterium]
MTKNKDWPVLQAILVGTISLAGWSVLYAFLEPIARWCAYRLLGLVPGTPLASATEFFRGSFSY